jgi:hypothetical protein
VCVVRRRRRQRFVSKSTVNRNSALNFSPPPLDGSVQSVSTAGEKYNCHVEAMKAMNAVNHRDSGVGVANCSKTMIRPMNASPRQTASGRVTLVSHVQYEPVKTDIPPSDHVNRSQYATTPFCTDVEYNCRTLDNNLSTFRHSPSLGHVPNIYWTYGNKRPIIS